MEGARTGQWDVAFLAIDPSREKDLDFTAPYMEVEVGYVVLGASPIKSMTDIDRPGVRVSVAGSGGTDIILSQILKRGTVVRAKDLTEAIEMLKQGKVEAMAANKPTLFAESAHIPTARFSKEALRPFSTRDGDADGTARRPSPTFA